MSYIYSQEEMDMIFGLDENGNGCIRFREYHFYPNICQVCQIHDKEKSLQRYSRCKMVSYYSKQHQTEHWSAHKECCTAVSDLQRGFEGSSFFTKQRYLPKEQHLDWKIHLLNIMEERLKRQVSGCEKQMITYPKVCSVCQETDKKLLKTCLKYPQGNLCNKHEDDEVHPNIWALYTYCCTVDAYYARSVEMQL